MAKRLSVAVFALIIFTGLFWGCGEGGQSADLILLNGKVYTLSWDEPVLDGTPARNAPFRRGRWEQDAEAVAVKDGKIMYVGSSRRARLVFNSDLAGSDHDNFYGLHAAITRRRGGIRIRI